MMKRSFVLLGLMLPLLGACSWAGQIAQGSVEGAASYYGREHFTLKAQVPANFGFVSKAQYAPREGQDCSFYSPELGGNMTRRGQKTDRSAAKATEQSVSFEIPLEYHIAGCAMDLTEVDTDIEGRYGPKSIDIGMDGGGISVRDSLPPQVPGFSPNGEKEFRGLCTWLFQFSVARIKKDEITKILSCNAANEQWKIAEDRFKRGKPGGAVRRDELSGRTVKMVFRLNPDERPAMGDTWIKFPRGWKRCLGKGLDDPYGFCRGNTTDFRTFEINGQKCTVYPGCTE